MDWQQNSFEILNALDKAILVIDRDYHILAANKAACKAFVSTLDDVIGKECFRVTHNVDSPCWMHNMRCPIRAAFELKEKTRVIHQHVYAGRPVLEEVVAFPLFDEKGEVKYVVEELNDVTELVQSKEIIDHLKAEVNTLRGIIPICASCKQIRTDDGYWQQVEVYIRNHSNAEFSHSICPTCAHRLYPEVFGKK